MADFAYSANNAYRPYIADMVLLANPPAFGVFADSADSVDSGVFVDSVESSGFVESSESADFVVSGESVDSVESGESGVFTDSGVFAESVDFAVFSDFSVSVVFSDFGVFGVFSISTQQAPPEPAAPVLSRVSASTHNGQSEPVPAGHPAPVTSSRIRRQSAGSAAVGLSLGSGSTKFCPRTNQQQ